MVLAGKLCAFGHPRKKKEPTLMTWCFADFYLARRVSTPQCFGIIFIYIWLLDWLCILGSLVILFLFWGDASWCILCFFMVCLWFHWDREIKKTPDIVLLGTRYKFDCEGQSAKEGWEKKCLSPTQWVLAWSTSAVSVSSAARCSQPFLDVSVNLERKMAMSDWMSCCCSKLIWFLTAFS